MNTIRTLAASKISLALAAATLLSVLSPALADATVMVNIGGKPNPSDPTAPSSPPTLKGDSTLRGYEGNIEAQSIDFGVFNPDGWEPVMSDLTFIKSLDSASAELALAGFTGTTFDRIEIAQLRTGGGKKPSLLFKVVLHGVRVTSVTVVATAEDPASESVTLKYKSMTLETYKSGKGGKSKRSGYATLQ